MRKEEFFKQLEYLLQDIPDADKEEALNYYRDYLDEAGSENEEQVLDEFGSPERVAAIIRADVTGNLKDGGSFTETGYEDERFRDPNYQMAKRLDLPDEREFSKEREQEVHHDTFYENRTSRSHQENEYEEGTYRECYTENKKETYHNSSRKRWGGSASKWIVGIILLLIASPFLIGAGGVLFGALTMVAAVIFGVVVLTAAAFIGSVVIAGLGVGFLFTTPLDSLFLFGIAVCGIGCGLLGAACVAGIFGMLLPYCLKGIWKGIQALIRKGKELL